MLRTKPGQFHQCKYYKRIDNSFEVQPKAYIFDAEIVGQSEYRQVQNIAGLHTAQVSLLIKTSNFPWEAKPGDDVEVLGQVYKISYIDIGFSDNPYQLGSNRFKATNVRARLPKYIGLE
jgi:hypothetical protein